jgi:hypothetical protein
LEPEFRAATFGDTDLGAHHQRRLPRLSSATAVRAYEAHPLFNSAEHANKMNMDLVRQCSDALRESRDLRVDVDPSRHHLLVGDAVLTYREMPRGVTLLGLPALRVERGEVLLLPYAGPPLAEALRAAGIEYIDAVGNAWISRTPLYLSIDGRKPAGRPNNGRPPLLAGGLKVVFALLSDPAAVALPYRGLAHRAGTSLGTVSNTIAWLREQGHLLSGRDGSIVVVERPRLRERWELGYLEILRKTLVLGQARLAGNAPIEALATRGTVDVLIGGELAAASLTGRLVAARATLHIREPLGPALNDLRLVPDPTGPVTLLRRFGEADEGPSYNGAPLAHPLLVRAELLLSGDARVREVADLLLERSTP